MRQDEARSQLIDGTSITSAVRTVYRVGDGHAQTRDRPGLQPGLEGRTHERGDGLGRRDGMSRGESPGSDRGVRG